jgi:hypothetical protein
MESGENPEQSGYCVAERIPLCHCESGKAGQAMKLSQDTCLNNYVALFSNEK